MRELKSLCGGGVPSSHPSLGLSVFFLFFFFRARVLANNIHPWHRHRLALSRSRGRQHLSSQPRTRTLATLACRPPPTGRRRWRCSVLANAPPCYHVQTPHFQSNFLASARGAREWSSRCAGWAGGGLGAFFRISEASVGRGGPLRASLSSTESSARQSAVLGPLSVLGRVRLACTPPWHVGRTTYPRTPR